MSWGSPTKSSTSYGQPSKATSNYGNSAKNTAVYSNYSIAGSVVTGGGIPIGLLLVLTYPGSGSGATSWGYAVENATSYSNEVKH